MTLSKNESDAIAPLLKKIEQLRSDWQPMSAFDRTKMQFVLVTDCDIVRLHLWCPEIQQWERTWPMGSRVVELSECREPTHWMLCPDPPEP